MERTQIQIEKDQIEWLRKKARDKEIPVSQLIREAIAFFRAHDGILHYGQKVVDTFLLIALW